MSSEMRPGLPWSDEVSDIGLLLLGAPGRPAWHADAACRDRHDVDFFPAHADDAAAVAAAVKLCANCPVRAECGTFAERWSTEGVWAGASRRPGSEPTGPAVCSCGKRCRTVGLWRHHRTLALEARPGTTHTLVVAG